MRYAYDSFINKWVVLIDDVVLSGYDTEEQLLDAYPELRMVRM